MTNSIVHLPQAARTSTEESEEGDSSAPLGRAEATGHNVPPRGQVVIVGAGIVGTVLALLLALNSKRWRKIILVERNDIASGSTAHSAACFRLQFTQFVNVAINKISRSLYKGQIADLLGYDPLKENGYLFLKETPEQMQTALKYASAQRGWGVEVDILSPVEVRSRFPYVETANLLGATFGSQDGFITSPEIIAKVCAEAAQELGVEVFPFTSVLRLEAERGRVARVVTTRGTIEADVVINCAGAWSQVIAKSVDCSLPVAPIPRQVCFVNAVSEVPQETCPMVVAPNGAYMRPEGRTLMLGYAPPDTTPDFHARYDHELAVRTVSMMAPYVPALYDAQIRPHGIAGLYEMTPDKNAIIRPDPTCGSLYHCTGFSGHGVMQGPGAAQLVFEMLEFRRPRSLHPLVYAAVSPNRFLLHQSLPEENVI